MRRSSYVYAILPAGATIPVGLAGLGHAPVRAVVRRQLAAAISQHTRDHPFSPTRDNLLRHEAVVRALAAEGPTLPVRFGAWLAGLAAVRSALEERDDTLRADLAHIG